MGSENLTQQGKLRPMHQYVRCKFLVQIGIFPCFSHIQKICNAKLYKTKPTYDQELSQKGNIQFNVHTFYNKTSNHEFCSNSHRLKGPDLIGFE